MTNLEIPKKGPVTSIKIIRNHQRGLPVIVLSAIHLLKRKLFGFISLKDFGKFESVSSIKFSVLSQNHKLMREADGVCIYVQHIPKFLNSFILSKMIPGTTSAFIFARKGSERLPNKNLLKIGGKTLLEHAISAAQEQVDIEHVFVSTDSTQMAELTEQMGAQVIVRPPELATSDSPEILSWKHALAYAEKTHGRFDFFLSIPPTSPLRRKDDVDRVREAMTDKTDIVVTISELKHSPWFDLVTLGDEGRVQLFSKPPSTIHRGQDAPPVYALSTVAYLAETSYVRKMDSLWDGVVNAVTVPPERAIEIDTRLDFEWCEYLFGRTTG